MNQSNERQSELLAQYLAAAERDPDAPLPEGLDPSLAAFAQDVDRLLPVPDPSPAFTRQLMARLSAREPDRARAGRGGPWSGLRGRLGVGAWRPAVGLATAALLALVLLLASVLVSRPQSVGAQEVIDRARAVHSVPANSAIQSLVMTSRSYGRPGLVPAPAPPGTILPAPAPGEGFGIALPPPGPGEPLQLETRQWFQAPDLFRIELLEPPPGLLGDGTFDVLVVSDGRAVWSYHAVGHTATRTAPPPRIGLGFSLLPGAAEVTDLDQFLERVRTCQAPQLRPGTERVAGRETYVVDLGPDRCVGVGPATVWVDTQTFLVLKVLALDPSGREPLVSSEVTDIAFNVPIEPGRFNFIPAAGVRIDDGPGVRVRAP